MNLGLCGRARAIFMPPFLCSQLEAQLELEAELLNAGHYEVHASINPPALYCDGLTGQYTVQSMHTSHLKARPGFEPGPFPVSFLCSSPPQALEMSHLI